MGRSTELTDELGKMGVAFITAVACRKPAERGGVVVLLSALCSLLSLSFAGFWPAVDLSLRPLTRGHPLRSGVGRDDCRRPHFAGEMKVDLGLPGLDRDYGITTLLLCTVYCVQITV